MNSGRTAADWERRFRREAKAGRPPDALRRYCADETERFWAWTVPGVDGHVYWAGAERFTRNDKRTRTPARWVWESLHGPIAVTTDVWQTCGERACVAPDHLEAGRSERRQWISMDALIGQAQVLAMRLGRTPLFRDWNEAGIRPSAYRASLRFGGWGKFMRAAGLVPRRDTEPRRVFTDEDMLAALTDLARHVGASPSHADVLRERAWLTARGYPLDPKSWRRRFGSWAEALRRAGL